MFKKTKPTLAKLRKDYGRGSLSRAEALPDPLLQFDLWFKQAQAAQLTEPHAMTLATVSSQLRPATRVVLMKGYDDQGIRWFTNYHSRKGQELAGNPYCALQFYWDALERVVRIEGRAEKLSGEENEAYFQSRPLASRLGAWASPQSQVVPGRSFLMAQAAHAAAKWGLTPPCPPHWGGYRLVPDVYEFWQGRPSRLHDRLRYRLNECLHGEEGGGQHAVWVCERLAP